jgi:hypothetical protein
MIELTVRLTDEQLAEIAERAAALIPTGAPAVSPWLNVAEAAERLRCRKDRDLRPDRSRQAPPPPRRPSRPTAP